MRQKKTLFLATGSVVLAACAGFFQACGGDTDVPLTDGGTTDDVTTQQDVVTQQDVNIPPPDDAAPDVPNPVDAGPLCTANPCVVGLAVGGHHACALIKDGTVRCWGANLFGQLGVGGSDAGFDGSAQNAPVAINGLTGVQSVSAATVYTTAGHTCARTATATFCWGVNSSGQLGQTNDAGAGLFDNQPHPAPLAPSGVTTSARTTSNNFNNCAIVGTDMICWGINADGANGRGGFPQNTVSGPGKILLGDGGAQVAGGAIGSEFGLALLTNGTLLSWGRNSNNALARTTVQQVDSTPAPIPNLADVVQVSAGEAHACVVNKTGQVLCWGDNAFGQLGRGTTGGNSNLPFAVPLGSGKLATQVAVSNAHSCAVTTDGLVYCWGRNNGGQSGPTGDGGLNQLPITVPTEVKVGGKAIAIGTGGANLNNSATGYTCVLLEGGAIQCWGFNGDGELGRGADAGTQNCQGVGPCSPTPANVVFP
jgi:alpha-tubulin suppressor-like RCC1 family protein